MSEILKKKFISYLLLLFIFATESLTGVIILFIYTYLVFFCLVLVYFKPLFEKDLQTSRNLHTLRMKKIILFYIFRTDIF